MTTYEVKVDGHSYSVGLEEGSPPVMDGAATSVSVEAQGRFLFSVLINGESRTVLAQRGEGVFEVLCEGTYHRVTVDTERTRLLRRFEAVGGETRRNAEIHAPMPAMVVKIEVAVGDEVQEGQGLVILEAMKMENEVRAPHAGRIKSVLAIQGKAVEKGQLLMLLE